MKLSKRLDGIGEYYFSTKLREIEELRQAGRDVINLGIGSPDLPPHPEVIETLNRESQKAGVHAYQSYKGSPVLRNAIADWYARWYDVKLDPGTEVLPLIGSKEGILHICMTYLNEGDKVLIPDPGYPTYRSAVKLAGGKPVTYELKEKNNWLPDWKKMEKLNLKKVKLMFINYPHMPTGQMPGRELFEGFVAFARANDILLVHDNPYSFILNPEPLSLLSIPGAKEVAIELNSLSKSHNMAGWRVGMLCGAEERINEVLRFKSNMDSGMFLPVQFAAARALQLGDAWHEEVNAVYRRRKQIVHQLLDALGCDYAATQAGMFVWAKAPARSDDGFDFSDEVLHHCSVFITPGGIFGKAGEKFIRVSLCATEERLQAALERVKKRNQTA